VVYIAGALVILFTATLGGITGFGASILSTPLLLLLGLPLRTIVIVNLTLVIVTRVTTSVRLRDHLSVRRPILLVLGSVPGIYCGTLLAAHVDATILKRSVGIICVATALFQIAVARRPPPPSIRGASVIAGYFGGVLSTTTSLNGIPPAILLARDRTAPRTFQADLALYFVCSNLIALAIIALRGTFVRHALVPTAVVWIPAALLGNALGTALGGRLPDRLFRYLAFLLAGVAGAVTALTA
jgi:uncharacterized membrane protein YfcA